MKAVFCKNVALKLLIMFYDDTVCELKLDV